MNNKVWRNPDFFRGIIIYYFGGISMYNQIEDIYKKKSPYNRIKTKMFIIYIIDIILLWIFNVNKLYILMVCTIIITFFVIKHLCEKELNTKLYFKIGDDKIDKPLNELIYEKERQLFIDYLKNKKIYNKETLECIINHYRSYIKTKIVGDNFWAIIAIVISIVLAFVTKEGFDIKMFEKSIPYLIGFVAIAIIIYHAIKGFAEIKKFFKGEDGLYENLESIFSELYIEFNCNNIKTKPVKKANNKRKKKSVIK